MCILIFNAFTLGGEYCLEQSKLTIIKRTIMNGKKAKLLRGLAGVNKENRDSRSYAGTNVKTKQVLSHDQIDAKGNPLVLGTYQTATYVLNAVHVK